MQNYLTIKNISAAVVVLVLITGGALYFFNTKTPQENDEGGFLDNIFPSSGEQLEDNVSSTPTPEAPGAGNIESSTDNPLSSGEARALPAGTLIQLTDDNISSMVTSVKGTVKYHKNISESLGHLFETEADGTGTEKKLSNYTVPQILKVVWSGNAVRAVVFYNVGGVVRKVLVDYSSSSTPKTNFLADSISDVAFSPDGKSIAFINDLGSTRNIFTATSDNKNPKKIADNNIPDMEISWPSTGSVALKTKSSYASVGYLYSVSVSSGALTKIAEGLGLDAVWANDGSGVIVSTVNGGGQMQPIKYFELKSQTSKEFSVNTIAEKCVFLRSDKKTVFCGAPKNIDQSRYPDDWWQGRVSFTDNFVSLNIADGTSAVFAPSVMDVVKPTALANDTYLLFQDKNTGFLWSLKLK